MPIFFQPCKKLSNVYFTPNDSCEKWLWNYDGDMAIFYFGAYLLLPNSNLIDAWDMDCKF